MIIIDSGNTACKIWIGEMMLRKSYNEGFSKDEISILKNKINQAVAYSSVAPKKFTQIIELLEKIGFNEFVDIGELAQKQKLVGAEVEGIGADRILGMIGAATFLKTPLITVDCGTAITVNLLLKENLCTGGAIFAGHSTQMRALTLSTEGVHYKSGEVFKNAVGKKTADALQSGVLHSIAGGIILLYKNFLKESSLEKADVVVTGGDGEMIVTQLSEEGLEVVFKNDLIKLGIEQVFKNMRKK